MTNRYYQDQNVDLRKCLHCGEQGHIKRSCPQLNNNSSSSGSVPAGEPRTSIGPSSPTGKPCQICASRQHKTHQCPTGLCFNCFRVGHMMNDCSRERRGTSINASCKICNLHGASHPDHSCPDHWRRYKWTPSSVTSSPRSKSVSGGDLYCYVCGAGGHVGDECRDSQQHRNRNQNWRLTSGSLSCHATDNLLKKRGYDGLLFWSRNAAANRNSNDYDDDVAIVGQKRGRNDYIAIDISDDDNARREQGYGYVNSRGHGYGGDGAERGDIDFRAPIQDNGLVGTLQTKKLKSSLDNLEKPQQQQRSEQQHQHQFNQYQQYQQSQMFQPYTQIPPPPMIPGNNNFYNNNAGVSIPPPPLPHPDIQFANTSGPPQQFAYSPPGYMHQYPPLPRIPSYNGPSLQPYPQQDQYGMGDPTHAYGYNNRPQQRNGGGGGGGRGQYLSNRGRNNYSNQQQQSRRRR